MKWSKEQLKAIQTSGHKILVSAAAGSGKTATLAERCVYQCCEADNPCDINRLLVVTFTQAAAVEMRGRIERSLHQALARFTQEGKTRQGERAKRQLALLAGAQISTLHGFCTGLLRRHFHLAGIDPQFTILDESESLLLKNEVASDLFEKQFESSAPFAKLIDLYADSNDLQIQTRMIHAYDVLESLTDPIAWRNEAINKINEVSTGSNLLETRLGADLEILALRRLDELAKHCEFAIASLRKFGEFKHHIQLIELVMGNISQAITFLNNNQWALASDILLQKLPRLKPCKEANKELAETILDSVRKPLKSDGEIFDLFHRSPEQMAREIAQTAEAAKTFLDLVQAFSDAYHQAKLRQYAVDFSDLEHLSLKVLVAGNGEVSRQCADRFAGIMVDEFQDINQIQWEIINRLTKHDQQGNPLNLFCVGDVKQSIYRFRMADPTIFLHRDQSWRPQGHVIDMQNNFRSRKPLLDAINFVFDQLMRNPSATEICYSSEHWLSGKREFPPSQAGEFTGAPITIHALIDEKDKPAKKGDAQAEDTGEQVQSEKSTNLDEDQPSLDQHEREARYVAGRINTLLAEGRKIADRQTGQLRPM